MSAIRLRHPAIRLAHTAAGLFAITLTTGCATTSVAPATIEPEPEARAHLVPDDWIPVARYGRYTRE